MVIIDKSLCTSCGACVSVCPVEAISLPESAAEIDHNVCTECETCVAECPSEAIKAKEGS